MDLDMCKCKSATLSLHLRCMRYPYMSCGVQPMQLHVDHLAATLRNTRLAATKCIYVLHHFCACYIVIVVVARLCGRRSFGRLAARRTAYFSITSAIAGTGWTVGVRTKTKGETISRAMHFCRRIM